MFVIIALFIFSIDYSQAYCLKDLSREVVNKLEQALKADEVARRHVYQSFGIRGNFRPRKNIFTLFPDTPVKLLKDVLEALQLYDLVDLLSEKPRPVRSLRLALPLHEIEQLRKTADNRPTTYHSSVAVLIIADEENSNIIELKNFFKGLNSKSDVTIFECRNALRTAIEIEWMESADLGTRSDIMYHFRYEDGRQELIQQQHELWGEIPKKQRELQTQIENIKTSVSAVIDRWIHNQGW